MNAELAQVDQAFVDAPATWCVLTKSRGGAVSLIRGMSEVTAREVSRRLNPPLGPGWRYCNDSDLVQIHVFDASIANDVGGAP